MMWSISCEAASRDPSALADILVITDSVNCYTDGDDSFQPWLVVSGSERDV